jgi:DNA repair protein SbcC/Rad50
LSYQEKQVIDFDGSTLWMLWGPNGVGKSAVFDAITFALFGAHRAGSGARNARELINHHADKFIIEFDFMIDGVAYRIRRTCAQNGRSTRLVCILQSNGLDDFADFSAIPIPETDGEDSLKEWVTRTVGLDYRAFTSSVLLLQGRSEQLLNADPKVRYEILAELIDLSRYQRLYEEADKRRKKYRDESGALEQQLQSPAVRAISDEEIAAIEAELQQASVEWQRLQTKDRQLTVLYEQARHWEQAATQLREQQEELNSALDVLTREDEITRGFTELQALGNVLPVLRRIEDRRKTIFEKIQSIANLQNIYQQVKIELFEAETKLNAANEGVKQLEQTLAELQGEQKQDTLRLLELNPLVKDLEQIEKWQTDIEKLDAELTNFLPDIAQCLGEAERLVRNLVAIDEALPWLEAFALARANFSKALDDMQRATEQTEELQAQIQELEIERTSLNAKLSEETLEERRLFEAKTRANSAYSDAVERLTNFENAATKRVCDLCGQEIKGDHVQREKVRLQKRIDETGRTSVELAEAYQQAQKQLLGNEQVLALLDKRIRNLTKKCSQSESEQQRAQIEVTQQEQQLRSAYRTIKTPFKEVIIAIEPSENAAWLTTAYPTESDLKALQQEFAEKNMQEAKMKQLREDYNERQKLDARKEVIHLQLEHLIQSLDLEVAKQARDGKAAIEQKQQSLDLELRQYEQKYNREKDHAQQASEEQKRLADRFHRSHTSLETEKATLGEIERTLQEDKEGLPQDWRDQAMSLKADGLKELEQRYNSLSPHEHLQDDLRSARQSKATCEQRINGLNQQIESYPLGARRPADEVEEELKDNKGLLSLADVKRSEVTQQLARMGKQREQRQSLEKQKHVADRLSHLYKLLADLLGRNGLQAYLLRRAEKTIVDLANNTLNGLSHSRMRLELRRESDATSIQTDKALDLVVYDHDTGQHAIPIGLVSGSQRFRIAVSLALAIGRYTSREARRIESVIIDEGFGSLDKAGRDDMIQELNTLSEQLERIILVSHQDEFANAFSDRYSFKLVKGASHVSLMEDD